MDEYSNEKGNWLEKLKPSIKNKAIHRKFKNLHHNEDTEELSKILGMDLNLSNLNNQSVLSQKWDDYVKQTKRTNELDFNNQSVVVNKKEVDNMSMISDNYDEINCIIGN